MVIHIDPHNGIPVYRQILDQVRFQVTAGILPPGAPLESVRNLAAKLGINSMTVSKAYAFLEKEGVVVRKPGQQLEVAATSYTQRESSCEEHVREALMPAVTVIRQLSVPTPQAVAILRELLDDSAKKKSDARHR